MSARAGRSRIRRAYSGGSVDIGTNAAGTGALPNAADGVRISSAPSNTIGGSATGQGNVIAGNALRGVLISGSAATGNLVQGNYIGTNAAGSGALPNAAEGVVITNGAPSNTIGGAAAGAGNVISGNGSRGVFISGATGNLVQGNYIGTNAAGTGALANGSVGVFVSGPSNTIGGTATGARNVISGNGSSGVLIYGSAGNLVQGNYIGTDATGSGALPNVFEGVLIDGAPSNRRW